MGSTNISGLASMFVQGQAKAAGTTEAKTEKAAGRFQEYLQQMSMRVSGELVSGQSQTKDAVVQSVIASGNDMADKVTSNASGSDTAEADAAVADYESYRYRCTEVKSRDDAEDMPDAKDVMEAVDDYAKEVVEVLKENLDVTDEQVAEALQTLGLSVMDLMNPNQLAALVSELTGKADAKDMLFDADFLQIMQKTDILSQKLLQELGITKEELQTLCETAEQVPVQDADVSDKTDSLLKPAEPVAGEAAAVVKPEAGNELTAENAENNALVSAENIAKGEQPDFAEQSQGTESLQKAQTKEQMTEAAADGVKIVAVTAEETKQEEPVKQQETAKEAGKTAEEAVPVMQKEPEESLKKDSFADNQQSLQQNQDTAKGQGEHAAQLVHHVETVEVPVAGNVPEQPNLSGQVDVTNIIREIVEFVKIHTTEQSTTLQMQLNPEHLGKVMLELTAKEGVVSARIFAQNEMVKEALEAQMVELRQNMNQAGIKVEAIEVTVESHEFERNLEQQANQERQQAEEQEKGTGHHRRINLMDAEGLDALSGMLSEEEALVAQIMADQGNSVDFTA